jgi:hypothetical protein
MRFGTRDVAAVVHAGGERNGGDARQIPVNDAIERSVGGIGVGRYLHAATEELPVGEGH